MNTPRNLNGAQNAGIGTGYDNQKTEGSAYIPSMLRRSSMPDRFKGAIQNYMIPGAPTPVTQYDLNNIRQTQSQQAADQLFPAKATPWDTMNKAYQRFGAENQQY